jgi:beta-carotene ketolase (CrtW type)
VWFALGIIALWATSLGFALKYAIDWASPVPYLWMLLQTHLYTGLFITAHDAMHGTVAPGRPWLNTAIGWVCTTLYAYNRYDILLPKHHAHHREVATTADPDYHPPHNENFFAWLFSFGRQYVTWGQLLLMAVTFNVLYRFLFPLPNVLLFWMAPALLSTLQLFYFGTYLPHRGMQDNKHHSRSQPKNHLWAFVSCYFFGYHYEHHDSPATPWWRLWRKKS